MINLNRAPGTKLLELGGGANPRVHPTCMGGTDVAVDVRTCYDQQGRQTVDFTADFNEPLPIQENEFDGVICVYCIEHLSFHKVRQFIAEMFRVTKPGGKVVVITADTAAQMEWIETHPNGWDGKSLFDAASEVLHGSQDYPENTHKVYFDPGVAEALFREAGFQAVKVLPYGERETDLAVEGVKPNAAVAQTGELDKSAVASIPAEPSAILRQEPAEVAALPKQPAAPSMSREEMFDKFYFNGGGKVGGYAREGYRDFACHQVTAEHILTRRPESVLEVGCARGYILKRIQDTEIPGHGLEISKHCHLTRVCEGIINHDVCQTPWPLRDVVQDRMGNAHNPIDLCYSVATMEHIPEEFVPAVIKEMARTCKRGLHGIDFGENDDGFDKTHCCLKSRQWWVDRFAEHAPDWPVEIVDKEALEAGPLSEAYIRGDGKVKVQVGSWTNMLHQGWINVDIADLRGFAQANRFQFHPMDVRQGMGLWNTGMVDMIFAHHFLEHLSYSEGLAFLRECRRVLKPRTGSMRIVVPDIHILASKYAINKDLDLFDEANDGCAAAGTPLQKFWSLAMSGHQAGYDRDTLRKMLVDAGFVPLASDFRDDCSNTDGRYAPAFKQLMAETTEMFADLSLFMNAVPSVV